MRIYKAMYKGPMAGVCSPDVPGEFPRDKWVTVSKEDYETLKGFQKKIFKFKSYRSRSRSQSKSE